MKHSEIAYAPRIPQPYLSEQEILILQSYLLKPGFHSIQVPDIVQGRVLLRTFVSSLNYFSRVALLSEIENGELTECINIASELKAVHAYSDPGQLEQYMLHAWDYDFLAIEGTKDLLSADWFGRFEQLLIDYDLIKTTPVLMLFYR